MTLLLLGINHRTAPIALREQAAISRERLTEALQAAAEIAGVRETMILSTCNRVEVLAVLENPQANVEGLFYQHLGMDALELRPHLYEYRDREAVRHLFRVAASLDSMVVGEPQILGQVKDAYAAAREAGTIAAGLEPLLQSAFAAAKKVRTETEIGSTSVSIASVAVELAQKIFGSLHGRTVFLVGAGKMSELAGRHLVQHGAGRILVTNRTLERAEGMARRFAEDGAGKVTVVRWEEMTTAAAQADIVITSTGAKEPIFRKADGQAFLHKRKNRPMFFIDIAVPRDVDPEMNRLEGIFLYDIDDLQAVAASHMAERTREAEDAEALITAEVERFELKRKTVDVAPLIVGLQQRAEEMRQGELKRAQSRLSGLTKEQLAAVDALTRGLVNKFLHPPMQALKQAAREGDAARMDVVQEMYVLGSPHGYSADAPVPESLEDAEGLVTAEEIAELLREGRL
jgi:glutamyl-tRNA reductase